MEPSPTPVENAEACEISLEALRFFDGDDVIDGLNDAISIADTNDLKQLLAAGADLMRAAGDTLGDAGFEIAQRQVRKDIADFCSAGLEE